MTDEQIAYTIAKMKEFGLVESDIALEKGIGCMDEAVIVDFYDKMVNAGVVKAGLDLSKGYTLEYVCRGLGMDLKN
jgi:NitT/TauT family transport system substrate-binding protein